MKFAGIILIVSGGVLCVKQYISTLSLQLEALSDWLKILRYWKDWIAGYGYSVNELITHTATNQTTANLSVSASLKNLDKNSLLSFLAEGNPLPSEERKIIYDLVADMGNSMVENELQNLTTVIKKLEINIAERERKYKDQVSLLYKLTPMLCIAAVILLW